MPTESSAPTIAPQAGTGNGILVAAPVLITTSAIVDDSYRLLAEEEAIPDGVDVMVPFARFVAEPALDARQGRGVGVVVPNDADVRALAPHLMRLSLVVLPLSTLREGRPYSQARILREELAYRGDLRATGEVVQDLLYFLARCGFNQFALRADQPTEACLAAFSSFGISYQGAADPREPLYRRRHPLRGGAHGASG